MVETPKLPGVDPALSKAVDIYRGCMEEIKIRLDAISRVLTAIRAEPNAPDGFMQAEFAFLQFRLVCELIAAATIAAHQPYGLSDELLESWNAELALLELSRLNPQAFPRAVTMTRHSEGVHFDFVPDALTKRGLVRHYKKCARVLHRGAIRHAFEGTTKIYDLVALERWSKRVGALLSHHMLMVLEECLVLVADLTAGRDGSVQVAIAQSPGPAILVEPAKG